MPDIDIVIPVYKPDKKLNRLMEKLCQQTTLPKTILLMYTMTGEKEEVENFEKHVRHLMQKFDEKGAVELKVCPLEKTEFNHGRTRKKGILLCQSPYVVCMTQDAVPKDVFLLERLLEAMKRYPKAASAYARQVADEKANEITKLTQSFNYPNEELVKNRNLYPLLGIKTIFCSDVCCMYDRNVFIKLGGFEDRVIFNEDMIYARHVIDAGYEVVYAADAKVIHWHNYNLRQQFKRNFDMAISQAEHPEVFADLSSEMEGIRMVKKVLSILYERNEFLDIFYYVLLSGAKYLGYRLGKMYKYLPGNVVLSMTMTPSYFPTEKKNTKQ